MTTRALVVAEAREWIETAWVHQACAKGLGVDCAQLVIGVGKAVDLFPQEFEEHNYDRRPDGASLLSLCRRHMDEVDIGEIVPGNVGVFRVARHPQHLAFFADYMHGGTSIIHALMNRGGQGKVVETVLDKPTLKRLVAVFQLRGIE
jgi:hypothetical protein